MGDLFDDSLQAYIRANSNYDEDVIDRICNEDKLQKLHTLVRNTVLLSECSATDVNTKKQLDKRIKELQNELQLTPAKVTKVKTVTEKKGKTIVTEVETIETVTTVSNSIADYERRFKEVANLDGDLTIYPLDQNNPDHHLQVKTNKEKSDAHGEVFTPLWLVDKMVGQAQLKTGNKDRTTLDLCAGYGQFSIRLMRAKCNAVKSFNKSHIEKFLTETHHFAEFQLSSCYKLLYIFGANINLFIGDARELPKLKDESKGVWVYSDADSKWLDITQSVKPFIESKDDYTNDTEIEFTQLVEKLKDTKNEIL